MSSSYIRAPHVVGTSGTQTEAPNAALLIDFDNVTMGMRSDLSKELKNLLNSDIIKGKVTVQRAYADWRRYPQYIVPLSENSVDLIFAPAYGSSKKNATDIRMAIDGMELVFIRPEIGTFILLTGDSDFSSLVLKLKEYGKYVIGVGIQESSSDILVQNCDEYYSYTSIAGLRKTTDIDSKAVDPWVLVEQAVKKMVARNDVMRSDRLKQVMLEIDSSFNEGNFGFSKFSKFLSEAASRDLVVLRKLDNGQFEVQPNDGRSGDHGSRGRSGSQTAHRKPESRDHSRSKERTEKDSGGGDQQSRPEAQPQAPARDEGKGRTTSQSSKAAPAESADLLKNAYALLTDALQSLSEGDGGPVRDSDLKRKMLRIQPKFDEGELGFGKFSRFLRQAHDHEVVDLEKVDQGTYQVSPRKAPSGPAGVASTPEPATPEEGAPPTGGGDHPSGDTSSVPQTPGSGKDSGDQRVGLRLRRGGTGSRKESDGPPPLLDGQVVTTGSMGGQPEVESKPETPATQPEGDLPSSTARTPRGRRGRGRGQSKSADPKGAGPKGVGSDQGPESSVSPVPQPTGEGIDAGALGLPTDGPALIRYLTNSYKGVGKKTAERLVEEFGVDGLYSVLQSDPERLSSVVPANRAEQLLKGWAADLTRRQERAKGGSNGGPEKTPDRSASTGGRRTRKGSRSRGRGSSEK